MAQNISKYTAEQLRQMAADCEQRVEESFQRSDTDGFLSQWAGGLSAQLYRRQAQIVEDGGLSTFAGLYEGDRRVAAQLIQSSFQGRTTWSWLLTDEEAKKFGRKFIPSNRIGKPGRIQKSLGLIERYELAPARARIGSEGTGLSGNAWVEVVRIGDRFGLDAKLIVEDNASIK